MEHGHQAAVRAPDQRRHVALNPGEASIGSAEPVRERERDRVLPGPDRIREDLPKGAVAPDQCIVVIGMHLPTHERKVGQRAPAPPQHLVSFHQDHPVPDEVVHAEPLTRELGPAAHPRAHLRTDRTGLERTDHGAVGWTGRILEEEHGWSSTALRKIGKRLHMAGHSHGLHIMITFRMNTTHPRIPAGGWPDPERSPLSRDLGYASRPSAHRNTP